MLNMKDMKDMKDMTLFDPLRRAHARLVGLLQPLQPLDAWFGHDRPDRSI